MGHRLDTTMLRCSTIAIFSLLVLGCTTDVEDRSNAFEAEGANSCVGRCGEQAPSGCFCDADCASHGDCCGDAENVCTISAACDDDGTDDGDGGGGSANQVCFLGPNRTNDVCLPVVSPGNVTGYNYPNPISNNYREPIAYIDLNAADPNTQLAPNFKLSELAQAHKGRYGVVQPHAVKRLQDIRDKAGALTVNSGYRSPSYNSGVGGATSSRHMFGDGFDIDPLSLTVNQLEPICTQNAGTLIEYTTHVHCDWRNTPVDPKFYGSAISLPGAPDAFAFDLPFKAEIVEGDGVLLVAVAGFDEGEPAKHWTALSENEDVLETFTGPEFVPPPGTASVTVDVGRVVEAVFEL